MTSISAGDRAEPTHHDLAVELAARHFLGRGFTACVVADILSDAPNGAIRDELARYPTKSGLAVAVATAAYAGFPFVTFNDNGVDESGLLRIGVCCHTVAHRFRTDVLAMATLRLKREAHLIEARMPDPFVVWLTLIEEMLQEAESNGEIHPGTPLTETAWLLVSTFFGMTEVSARMGMGEEIHDRITTWMTAAFAYLGCPDPDGIAARALSLTGH